MVKPNLFAAREREAKLTSMAEVPMPLNAIETLAVSGSPEIDNDPPP